MSEHRISVEWARNGTPFVRGEQASGHSVRFPGGQALNASRAPDYGGDAAAADPEQMLLAALSSCHMLTFLAVAANRGYVVDDYADEAVARVGRTAEGRTAVIEATLAPRVTFSGERQPTADEYAKLHERAHAACFIANSVTTRVEVHPTLA